MSNIYYYVHTGHRFGLDRFRRAATIIRALKDINITLLSSDYRIAASAKEFGVDRAIGIDVLRNIPNVAEVGDILIYDSPEHNQMQLEDMIEYFSKFIRFSDSIEDRVFQGEYLINPHLKGSQINNALAIDEAFFGEFKKSREIGIFFGDDDYNQDLLRLAPFFSSLNPDVLMGFYYFFDYEERLSEYFTMVDNEEYSDFIKSTKTLITSSAQAALEAAAANSNPIYFQRSDYLDEAIPLMEKFGIPVLSEFNLESIEKVVKMKKNYKKIGSSVIRIAKSIVKIIDS